MAQRSERSIEALDFNNFSSQRFCVYASGWAEGEAENTTEEKIDFYFHRDVMYECPYSAWILRKRGLFLSELDKN